MAAWWSEKTKVVIKGNKGNKAVIGKKTVTIINAHQSEEQNTTRNGDSTALYAAYTVDTVDMVYTVDSVYPLLHLALFDISI